MAQEKQGKWQKKSLCQGKHRESGNFAKNTGNFVCSSCKFPDSKGEGYCGIYREHFQKIFSRSWIGLPSLFCVCNSHKLCKLTQGNFEVGQGKHRGNTI